MKSGGSISVQLAVESGSRVVQVNGSRIQAQHGQPGSMATKSLQERLAGAKQAKSCQHFRKGSHPEQRHLPGNVFF